MIFSDVCQMCGYFVYNPVLSITEKVEATDSCFDCVMHTHLSLAKYFNLNKFVDLLHSFCVTYNPAWKFPSACKPRLKHFELC